MIQRKRKCTSCKETFATPASFYEHKRAGGVCRDVPTMKTMGFKMTKDGWISGKTKGVADV